MRTLLVLSIMLVSSTASASPDVELGLAVNTPVGWLARDAVAGSGFIGISKHHAVRINMAAYRYHRMNLLVDFATGFETDCCTAEGRFIDTSIGWMGFAKRLWEGPFVEAGPLVRVRDTHFADYAHFPEHTATQTTMIGGRAHLGYSWLISNRVFIAFAVGMSTGKETGHETTWPDIVSDGMPMTHSVSRMVTKGEWFLRIGGRFAL